MASQILQQVEAAAAQVAAKPIPEVLEQLQQIAQSAPENPIPHLVMAVVSGFARHDFSDSRQHLENARQLLDQMGAREMPEVERDFARNLHAVLDNELVLGEARLARLAGRRLMTEDRSRMLRAARDSRQALERLGELAPQLKESALVRTIYPAMLTHAQSLGIKTDEYRRGLRSLRTLAQSQQGVADLAGLFLMYGYRRARDYRRAVEVGQLLVKRNPRSVLPKVMLGNAHYFAGNPREAADQFKRAMAIAPNDPHPHLAYANLLERTGQLQEAREVLQKARQLDRSGRLVAFAEITQNLIQAREAAGPP